jgi:pimeloyl-ACP methyl ester carboxylesterase
MTTVRNGDVVLSYERRGHGPRLLVLLGSGMTVDTSGVLVDLFAGSFEVLVGDYRGLGLSGPAPAPYDMAACAADALAVMDDARWAAARVLGISFGGMVAQELAVTAPGRVERLALLCTSAGGPGGSSYPLHELAERPTDERVATGRLLLDSRFDEPWLATHPGDRALARMMSDRDRHQDPTTGPGRRAQLEARRTHDVWDRLGRIACPTFVGCGRYDRIAPPANGAALAGRIPGATLHTYEGGHAFMAQDPASLTDVLSFLLGPGPGRGRV